MKTGQLDQIEIPQQPLDILAQQIVAAVACERVADESGIGNELKADAESLKAESLKA